MPRWTLQELKEYERRRQAGAEGLCPAKPEPDSGGTLDSAAPRETAGNESVTGRYRITFYIYRVRPLDWDNHFTKPIQDLLVEGGLLPDDNWQVLQGTVCSCKAKSRKDERTEIVIERL